jgi:hypothetical protein
LTRATSVEARDRIDGAADRDESARRLLGQQIVGQWFTAAMVSRLRTRPRPLSWDWIFDDPYGVVRV